MWWGDIKTLNIWKEKPKEKKKNNLDESVEVLDLSKRAYNCIKRNNLNTIEDVIRFINDGKLIRLHGMGAKSAEEIETKVKEFMSKE